MTKSQLAKMPGIYDVLNFGKYKGSTIFDIIIKNPSYIVWCIKNVNDFKIDESLKKDLLISYEKHRQWLRNDGPEIKHLMNHYGMHASEAIDFLENNEAPEYF